MEVACCGRRRRLRSRLDDAGMLVALCVAGCLCTRTYADHTSQRSGRPLWIALALDDKGALLATRQRNFASVGFKRCSFGRSGPWCRGKPLDPRVGRLRTGQSVLEYSKTSKHRLTLVLAWRALHSWWRYRGLAVCCGEHSGRASAVIP